MKLNKISNIFTIHKHDQIYENQGLLHKLLILTHDYTKQIKI
jgi:hypothetical protein